MQPESYRHDYTAVEQRLRQLESVAYYKRLLGRSALVLAVTAAACALVLCAALAWRIATRPHQIEAVAERVERPPVPPGPALPDLPGTSADEPGVVTTNFTLFRERQVGIGDRTYFVTAGHKYLTETDATFADAWCYTRRTIGGVDIQIDLGTLEPGSVPVPGSVSSQTLAQTDLTPANLLTLFEGCPWLSGNPNVEDAVPPSGESPNI